MSFNTTLVKVHPAKFIDVQAYGFSFNTTLVKVHLKNYLLIDLYRLSFNTTLVKVHLEDESEADTSTLFQYNTC